MGKEANEFCLIFLFILEGEKIKDADFIYYEVFV